VDSQDTRIEKIEWSAPEYEHREKSGDWFWALGVVVFASSAAAAIFGNYFFAILLVLGGVLLGYMTLREPETVDFELNEKGLKIRDKLYSYPEIKSFWVDKEKPTLFIKSGRVFIPILNIPIEEESKDKIHAAFLAKNIPEEEMREHPSEKVIDMLGF